MPSTLDPCADLGEAPFEDGVDRCEPGLIHVRDLPNVLGGLGRMTLTPVSLAGDRSVPQTGSQTGYGQAQTLTLPMALPPGILDAGS